MVILDTYDPDWERKFSEQEALADELLAEIDRSATLRDELWNKDSTHETILECRKAARQSEAIFYTQFQTAQKAIEWHEDALMEELRGIWASGTCANQPTAQDIASKMPETMDDFSKASTAVGVRFGLEAEQEALNPIAENLVALTKLHNPEKLTTLKAIEDQYDRQAQTFENDVAAQMGSVNQVKAALGNLLKG